MNVAPLQRVAKFCRRRPWLCATVFVFVFLNLVPTWPYTPTCGPHYPGKDIILKTKMSADYRTSLKSHFRAYNVYHWDIGGIILVRLLPFMDDMGDMAQIDGIGNANSKAAWALADERYIGTYVGHELNGRIYRVPDFIEALRDPKTGDFDTISCGFMVPVVTGKPSREPSSGERK